MPIKKYFEKVKEKNVGELDPLAGPVSQDQDLRLRKSLSMRFFENLSDLFLEYAKSSVRPIAAF